MKLLPLLAILALTASAGELSSDGPPILPSQSIPSTPPLTAVFVIQCDHVIGLFVSMPDGDLKLFNMKSHVDYEALIHWAESGKRRATAETECVSVL